MKLLLMMIFFCNAQYVPNLDCSKHYLKDSCVSATQAYTTICIWCETQISASCITMPCDDNITEFTYHCDHGAFYDNNCAFKTLNRQIVLWVLLIYFELAIFSWSINVGILIIKKSCINACINGHETWASLIYNLIKFYIGMLIIMVAIGSFFWIFYLFGLGLDNLSQASLISILPITTLMLFAAFKLSHQLSGGMFRWCLFMICLIASAIVWSVVQDQKNHLWLNALSLCIGCSDVIFLMLSWTIRVKDAKRQGEFSLLLTQTPWPFRCNFFCIITLICWILCVIVGIEITILRKSCALLFAITSSIFALKYFKNDIDLLKQDQNLIILLQKKFFQVIVCFCFEIFGFFVVIVLDITNITTEFISDFFAMLVLFCIVISIAIIYHYFKTIRGHQIVELSQFLLKRRLLMNLLQERGIANMILHF